MTPSDHSDIRALGIAELLALLLEDHSEASVLGPIADGPLFSKLQLWLAGRHFYVTIEEGLPQGMPVPPAMIRSADL